MPKKLWTSLMTLLILVNSLLGFSSAVAHAQTNSSAIQFVDSVTMKDSTGKAVGTTKISNSSAVQLLYQLKLPDGDVDPTATYTMPLPPELRCEITTPVEITASDGTVLGHLTVTNGQINLTFTNAINQLANRTINFAIWAKFNKDTLDYSNGNDLVFPTANNVENILHVNFYESDSGIGSGTSAISKTLRYEGGNVVDWTVTINKGGYAVDDAVFEDTMENTQSYIQGSLTVNYRNYKEKSVPVSTETPNLTFTPNSDGSQSANIHFGTLTSKNVMDANAVTSIVIHYQTKMSYNEKDNRYPNHATLYNGNVQVDRAASTATYRANQAGGDGDRVSNVMVKYVDDSGNPLASDVILSGNVGSTFSADQKSFDGYTLKTIQGDPQGTFSDQDQEITFIYSKTPVMSGRITVKYVDDEGHVLTDSDILTGNVGENYQTNPKAINGYTLKEVTGQPKGHYTDQDQIITYIYTKNQVDNPATGPDNPSSSSSSSS
ncbi:MucBP domain-containing protein, partial [Levilactobacillus bambusae]